jgi:hypothetical protein
MLTAFFSRLYSTNPASPSGLSGSPAIEHDDLARPRALCIRERRPEQIEIGDAAAGKRPALPVEAQKAAEPVKNMRCCGMNSR